jgi:hypothetical protein
MYARARNAASLRDVRVCLYCTGAREDRGFLRLVGVLRAPLVVLPGLFHAGSERSCVDPLGAEPRLLRGVAHDNACLCHGPFGAR